MQPVNPDVLDALFWLAVAGCAIAQFFILRTAFRRAPDVGGSGTDAGPMMVPSSRRPMEIVWAILPVFLLGAVFYLAWHAMHVTVISIQT